LEIVRITRAEFEEFRTLQRKHRWDWPAVFSANRRNEIWAFVTRGYTPFENRQNLRGISRVLDIVANKYRISRSDLGRFFIDERGGFYKDESNIEHQFCEFEWLEEGS
jgi:hypothetical protein